MNTVDYRRMAILAPLVLALALGQAAHPRAAVPQEAVFPGTGRFLVAGPGMQDPRFIGAVILLLRHDGSGSTGVVLNRPTDAKLSGVFPRLRGTKRGEEPLYFGGPVGRNQVLMLLRSPRPVRNAERVLEDVFVTISRRVMLGATARPAAGAVYRVYAGYAGWTGGQLEREIRRGDWAVLEADADIVFHDDGAKLWQELFRKSSEIEVRVREREPMIGGGREQSVKAPCPVFLSANVPGLRCQRT